MSGLLSRILGSGAHRKGAADPVVLYDDGVHGSMWEDADASYFRVLKRQDVTRGNKHVVLKVDPSGIVIMDKHMQNDLSYHPFATIKCYQADNKRRTFAFMDVRRGVETVHEVYLNDSGILHTLVGQYIEQLLEQIAAKKAAERADAAAAASATAAAAPQTAVTAAAPSAGGATARPEVNLEANTALSSGLAPPPQPSRRARLRRQTPSGRIIEEGEANPFANIPLQGSSGTSGNNNNNGGGGAGGGGGDLFAAFSSTAAPATTSGAPVATGNLLDVDTLRSTLELSNSPDSPRLRAAEQDPVLMRRRNSLSNLLRRRPSVDVLVDRNIAVKDEAASTQDLIVLSPEKPSSAASPLHRRVMERHLQRRPSRDELFDMNVFRDATTAASGGNNPFAAAIADGASAAPPPATAAAPGGISDNDFFSALGA